MHLPAIVVPENARSNNAKRRLRSRRSPKQLEATAKRRRAIYFPRSEQIQSAREQLPCYMHEQEFIECVRKNDIVMLSGATGSGKTTQIPQFLLEEFIGGDKRGNIVVTQPRRVAAVSCARRVATELGEKDIGKLVGYHVRHQPVTSPQTRLKFVTDGVLLREIESNLLLEAYDAVVIDEAHERSLNTDLLLALLSRTVSMRRSIGTPLKVVIMSATLDNAGVFTGEGGLFPTAPTLTVPSRQHPVTIHFARVTHENYLVEARKKIRKIHMELPPGGILVFVSGRREVTQLCEQISEEFEKREVKPEGAQHGMKAHVLPFYALLPEHLQHTVFKDPGPRARKIIIATNVAETSITIPGITYVVDTGKVKEQVYGGAGGGLLSSYEVRWVSKASAEQRAGRAGREGPGHVYRLYSSAVFDQQFAEFREAEVRRVPADSIVMRLRSLGILHVDKFPFPTKPDAEALLEAQSQLELIGALQSGNCIMPSLTDIGGKEVSSADNETLLGVTKLGRELAKIPAPPRYARMILAARDYRNIVPLVCRVAAMLSVGSVFDRTTRHAWQKQSLFAHPASDVLTELNAICGADKAGWDAGDAQSRSNNAVREYCDKHSLHFKTMVEILATSEQLEQTATSAEASKTDNDQKMMMRSKAVLPNGVSKTADRKVLRAMICGFPDKIARRLSRDESSALGVARRWQNCAFAVSGCREAVFLSSRSAVRLGNEVEYVVFGQLVRTSDSRKRGQRAVDACENDGEDEYKEDDAKWDADDSNKDECGEKEDDKVIADVDEPGCGGRNPKESRIMMENVSVVNATWIANNATSMCEMDVSRDSMRTANKYGVRCVYDSKRDMVQVSMKAKYGGSKWNLGTVMVGYRNSIVILQRQQKEEEIIRAVKSAASAAFAKAVVEGEANITCGDMKKRKMNVLIAEFLARDVFSKEEYDRDEEKKKKTEKGSG